MKRSYRKTLVAGALAACAIAPVAAQQVTFMTGPQGGSWIPLGGALKGMWEKAVSALDVNPGWLSQDAWVIVQIDPREYQASGLAHLVEFDQRRYGTTLLVFFSPP